MWPKNTGLDKQENWEWRLCSSTVSIPIFLSSYFFFLNREHLLDGRLTLVKFYSRRLVRVHHGPGLSLCFQCAVWKQLTWRRLVLSKWSGALCDITQRVRANISSEIWGRVLNCEVKDWNRESSDRPRPRFPCLNQRDIDRQAWVIVLNSCPGAAHVALA